MTAGARWVRSGERSEADFPFGEPRELDRGGSHGLLTRAVDRRLPVFEGEVPVQLKFLADRLHSLDVDIVERCASFDKESSTRANARYAKLHLAGWTARRTVLVPYPHKTRLERDTDQ